MELPPVRPIAIFRAPIDLWRWGGGVNNRMRFTYRIDMWDNHGRIVDHLAGVEDLRLAIATYLVACQRWPKAAITLREGLRVIEDSRRTRRP
jgi:hypothetical protein